VITLSGAARGGHAPGMQAGLGGAYFIETTSNCNIFLSANKPIFI